jgi:hypothetical protein
MNQSCYDSTDPSDTLQPSNPSFFASASSFPPFISPFAPEVTFFSAFVVVFKIILAPIFEPS